MVLGLFVGSSLLSGVDLAAAPSTTVHPAVWPEKPPALPTDTAIEMRISTLLSEMTLEQKVGQLIQADIASITPDDLRHYPSARS